MTILAELLHKNPVFASLSQSDFVDAMRMASSRSYLTGEKVILYGDVWPYFFLVGQGLVEAMKESSEGRSLRVASFGAGEIFWGLAFFNENAPMPVTLEARQDSLLHLWPRDSILPILMRNGEASWELCRLMAERMQRASEIVEGLAFQPVAGRLARLLLDHFQEAGGTTVARSLTLDEMAAHIGTTREVVCRFLHRLSDAGLISISRTEFIVSDQSGLEGLARQVKG